MNYFQSPVSAQGYSTFHAFQSNQKIKTNKQTNQQTKTTKQWKSSRSGILPAWNFTVYTPQAQAFAQLVMGCRIKFIPCFQGCTWDDFAASIHYLKSASQYEEPKPTTGLKNGIGIQENAVTTWRSWCCFRLYTILAWLSIPISDYKQRINTVQPLKGGYKEGGDCLFTRSKVEKSNGSKLLLTGFWLDTSEIFSRWEKSATGIISPGKWWIPHGWKLLRFD